MWSMGSEMKGSRLARLPGIATGTANRGHPVPEEPAGVLANRCCHEGSSGKPARRPTGVGSDLDKGCSRSPNVSGHSNTGRPASESLKGRHSIAHGAAPPVASRPGAGTLGRNPGAVGAKPGRSEGAKQGPLTTASLPRRQSQLPGDFLKTTCRDAPGRTRPALGRPGADTHC